MLLVMVVGTSLGRVVAAWLEHQLALRHVYLTDPPANLSEILLLRAGKTDPARPLNKQKTEPIVKRIGLVLQRIFGNSPPSDRTPGIISRQNRWAWLRDRRGVLSCLKVHLN
jgi:hypothetical protein